MRAGLRGFASYLPFLLVLLAPALAQAAIWQELAPAAARGADAVPAYYRSLKADHAQLRQALAAAPRELTSSQGASLALPLPQGGTQLFEVEESPVMAPALAADYPEIHTYRVRGIDDPSVSGRLDMTPSGFHAMLVSPGGTIFIDPDGSGNYRSYFKRDYAQAVGASADRVCRLNELEPSASADAALPALAQRSVSAAQRRIYRLAVAVTGEYAQYFNASQTAIVSNVVTTVNRVNQIYGRDLAVQLQLVKVVIYTDPSSDPFTQTSSAVATMLSQNQQTLDFEVGVDNYDIGHLFGLVGGGLARVGATCTASKAEGYTGYPVPDSDVFYIDFVAHEIGHQLNATHSFNGTTGACAGGNRTATSAVEPGSGSTIMAYAGICGAENLQDNSDATFHARSIQQINSFVFSGTGSSCGSLASTGDSLPSTVGAAGADLTIPQSTPFVLTGSEISDPDGDALSYQWDEIDSGGVNGFTNSTTFGSDREINPLFRSFVPVNTPTRYFPRLSTLISGSTDKGETLPTTQRNLNFRLTVRDGNSGVADDDVVVSVDTSMGPFRINGGELNRPGGLTYTGGFEQTLMWYPAGTTADCPAVSISLLSISADGSTYCDKADYPSLLDLGTFPNTVSVLNSASASVTLPNAVIERARIVLACEDNGFFDLSDADFGVVGTTSVASDCKPIDGEPLAHGTVFNSASTNVPVKLIGRAAGGGGGSLLWLPLLLGLSSLLRVHRRCYVED